MDSPAEMKFHSAMPVIYIQKNFPTQEKDLWPDLTGHAPFRHDLRVSWEITRFDLVSFYLGGLCTRAVTQASLED